MKNRRDFFRNTLGLSAIFATAPRLFADARESGTGKDMKNMGHATERGSGPIVRVETPDVPQLAWRMDAGVKEFHLIAEPVKQEIVPGRVIDLWGFNGTAPGPTIQVNQGDRVRIIVDNRLPEATSMHWHGFEVAVEMDGSPGSSQDPIPPGGFLSMSSRSTRRAPTSTTRTWRCKK
jgi:manganese oxidase